MDPEVTNFETGNSLVKFSLATSEFYKDKEGNRNKNTQWHHLVAWNSVAKNIGRLLRKGSELAVEGRLNHRQYNDKDGNKKYITEIVVNDFVMPGKKRKKTINNLHFLQKAGFQRFNFQISRFFIV